MRPLGMCCCQTLENGKGPDATGSDAAGSFIEICIHVSQRAMATTMAKQRSSRGFDSNTFENIPRGQHQVNSFFPTFPVTTDGFDSLIARSLRQHFGLKPMRLWHQDAHLSPRNAFRIDLPELFQHLAIS